MTEPRGPDVLLLRSAKDPDPYVQAFGEEGLEAECRPVLRFEFVDARALRPILQQCSRYAGVIATSPRAAQALRKVFDGDGTLHSQWKGTPAYVVGPKTGDRFRALGFDVRGEDTGSAKALAELLVDEAPGTPLLFLSGNRRRDTLPSGLDAAGIPFEEQVVYETLLRTDITLPPPRRGCWLAIFSPSGLEAVKKADVGSLGEYRCAAIGPTTADFLREEGLQVRAVAETPSPQGLVQAITTAS